MPLIVHNTLTGKKEEFVPLDPPRVRMYACGITAYDSCHLGHARAAIVFDVIARHLRHSGYELTYARNYTDVDDKIIARAAKEGAACADISKRYIEEYEADMAALGVAPPDIAPRATEHIACMIETVERLMERGLAYVTPSGVYFSVRKFPGYGRLSGKDIEDLESGARVEVDETKGDPLDFALWKSAKPGEPSWPSPWGEGRPGWHIECSAMSAKHLGQPFDIHGGGRDLIFPHHENEIAQAEGAAGRQFVRYWLHNGFININAEKMSKSLGNIATIREVLKAYDAEAIRLFILSSHYRSPIDYTKQAMDDAAASLGRFYDAAMRLESFSKEAPSAEPPGKEAEELARALSAFGGAFQAAMDDDFNTAMAVGLVFEAVRLANRFLDAAGAAAGPFASWAAREFKSMQATAGGVMGVFGSAPAEYRGRVAKRAGSARGISQEEIERLIAERGEARAAKNFKRADAIRAALLSKGVEIKDRPDGQTEWKFKGV